jgi:hypothetical protein
MCQPSAVRSARPPVAVVVKGASAAVVLVAVPLDADLQVEKLPVDLVSKATGHHLVVADNGR